MIEAGLAIALQASERYQQQRARFKQDNLPGILQQAHALAKLGQQPFHSSYDPEGNRMLVTTNVDGMVNVIDMRTRLVVQKVPVTKAHGIVTVGIQAGQ